jgi:hypothetical protein
MALAFRRRAVCLAVIWGSVLWWGRPFACPHELIILHIKLLSTYYFYKFNLFLGAAGERARGPLICIFISNSL